MVTLVIGSGCPAAAVAGLVAQPLSLGAWLCAVAQHGCDHGLHKHTTLRARPIPVVGGINVLVHMAM